MSIDHLQPGEIEFYLKGMVDEIEEERVIQHLGECEICLEEVERLWNEIEGIGSLDHERIKEQLLKKINRTNLMGHFIRLNIKGFLYMITGLLYPFQLNKKVNNLKEESNHE